MKIKYSNKKPWGAVVIDGCEIYSAGCSVDNEFLAQSFKDKNYQKIVDYISDLSGNFSIIITDGNAAFSCVDRCRSIPVFYNMTGLISNCAIELSNHTEKDVDELSCLEASMSGYVSGKNTVISAIKQLQAGEYLLENSLNGSIAVEQYFKYIPKVDLLKTKDDLINELDNVFNTVIHDVMKAANGNKIWIPLSAGWDSRIIACKLKELNYPNIETFSYGMNGSKEAKYAKVVADRLNLPWRFVHCTWKEMNDLYENGTLDEYWKFSGGLSCLPNPQDILPLYKMKLSKLIKEGDFIVNGQTGDFISGGHIPDVLLSPKADYNDLMNYIIKKHYSLWDELLVDENIEKIKERILPEFDNSQSILSQYETWEFQERQAKYVVNGQRVYDFLGLNWCLPMWSKEFVDFWMIVPYEDKYKQRLYKEYLLKYNYQKLFGEVIPRDLQVFYGKFQIFILVSIVLGKLIGDKNRNKIMKILQYYDRYNYLCAPFGFWKYAKNASNIRNPLSLLTQLWLSTIGCKKRFIK